METKEKKKVLYFVPQFPVLSETFIEREISKLVELGKLDITILSLAPGTGTISENLKDKIKYVRLSVSVCFSAFFRYVIMNPRKILRFHQLVKGEDRLPYISLSNFSTKSRFVHFWKGVAFAKVVERYSPEHIHVHFLSEASTMMMIAAGILNISFSVSAHAKDVFVQGTLIPAKAKESKFIAVCNGHAWKKVVDEANKTKSSGKIKLLYHGVDQEKLFNVNPMQKLDKPFIFTVARLVEKKGLKYLVDASEVLKNRGIEHYIKIAGGGPLYDELRTYVSTKNLGDTVEILGEGRGIPNAEVARYLLIADIYCAPFIETAEGDVDGVPTTVIEAALARLPIVATTSGGITDLVNKNTGWLIPQKDPIALADALEKLIFDKQLSEKLGGSAYTQAFAQFNIDKNVGELEKLLLK